MPETVDYLSEGWDANLLRGISSGNISALPAGATLDTLDAAQSLNDLIATPNDPNSFGSSEYNGNLQIGRDGNIFANVNGYDDGIGFFLGWSDTTYKFFIGDSAGNKLTWDGTTLSVTGTITVIAGSIAGLTITATALTATAGGNSTIVSSGATAFTAGPTGSPTFTVTQAGVLTATSALIGSWTVGATTITGTGVTMSGTGDAYIAFGTTPPTSPTVGTGVFINKTGLFGLSANTQNFSISAVDGSITSIKGTISGFTITSSSLSIVSGGNTTTISSGATSFLSGPTGSPTFSVTLAGALTSTSAIIGGWVVTATAIKDAAGVVGMSSAVTGGDDIRFWAGNATPASAPFYVTEAGVLVASSATISGSITASSGTIGGFSIGADYIRDAANSMGMASTVTGGDDVRFWAGDTFANRATAPFRVTEAGVFAATSGNILGSLTVGSGTPDIVIDGVNKRIRTSTYSAGLQGWTIESDGSAEFGNITARGEFHTQVLSYNEVHATAGTAGVFKSAGKLRNDVTTLTSPSTFNVDIDDPDTGHVQLFAVSDILRIKDGSGSDNWFTISSVSDQTTFYRYVCTKSNGSNTTFRAGAAVVDYGPTGKGFLYMTADDANGPFYSVRTHAGSPWSTTTERLRLGNLNGMLDYVSELYGIAIGETNKFLKYDSTNGLRVSGQLNPQIETTSGENLTAGQIAVLRTYTTKTGKSTSVARPGDDARVNQASPGTNYATATTATIGDDAGGNANYFFMKWDISASSFPTVASRCYIRLHWATNVNLAGVATNHRVNVYKVTGADWSEGTITWTNMPAINGTAEDSWSVSPDDSFVLVDGIYGQVTSTAGAYIFLDITDLYNSWKSGGTNNYGIALRLEKAAGGETSDVRITDLATDENATTANKPTLIFTGPLPSNVGYAYKAQANDIDLSRGQLGIVINTSTSGNPVTIQTAGIVTNQSGLTSGKTYYLDTTSGQITTTPSNRLIGTALTSTSLLLNIEPPEPMSLYFKYVYGGLTTAGADTSVVNKIPILFGFDASNYKFTGVSSKAGSSAVALGEQFGTGGNAYSIVGTTVKNIDQIVTDGVSAPYNAVMLLTSAGFSGAITPHCDALTFQWDTDNTNDNTIEGWITITP